VRAPGLCVRPRCTFSASRFVRVLRWYGCGRLGALCVAVCARPGALSVLRGLFVCLVVLGVGGWVLCASRLVRVPRCTFSASRFVRAPPVHLLCIAVCERAVWGGLRARGAPSVHRGFCVRPRSTFSASRFLRAPPVHLLCIAVRERAPLWGMGVASSRYTFCASRFVRVPRFCGCGCGRLSGLCIAVCACPGALSVHRGLCACRMGGHLCIAVCACVPSGREGSRCTLCASQFVRVPGWFGCGLASSRYTSCASLFVV